MDEVTTVDAGAGARERGGDHRGVALLLGAAAIVAALVAARSGALANDAADAWQSALRTEVQRSAAALEDIRYLYQAELPGAMTVVTQRVLEDELRSAADAASGPAAGALSMEADIAKGVVGATESSIELVSNPDYALPDGGLDLGRRLADLRAEAPDMVALDPDARQAPGDALAARAGTMILALLPLGLAALLGAVAQPFPRFRRALLGAGTVALAGGVVLALGAELVA